jgi:hypothetical protein
MTLSRGLAALALTAPVTAQTAVDEAAYYAVDYLTPPEGCVLETGGLGFLSDGRLAVSTRRGQVWLVENPLAADPAEARFSLFAEGLCEGLGLTIVDDQIWVLQRGELSRLADEDQDGVCDRIDTLCDGWGLSGNYHEFAYGLPRDARGDVYITLNVSFFSPKWWHGKAPVPWRGWALRISPDGELHPFASGFRSPAGLSLSPQGELFVTDNQGDWMPASPVFLVEEGGFYGHPASLDWTSEYQASHTLASDTIPPERAATDRKPAAIWLPYSWSRSPGNLAWDTTGGAFGPFEGQIFVAELTNGMILRGDLETVNGVRQGWVTPFRKRVGSSVRVLFAPDGTLLAGCTNRGWGGLPPADGIARVRWTATTPLEVKSVRLARAADSRLGDASAFEITFTKPLDPNATIQAKVEQYDYDYWWEYGSPERATKELESGVRTWPNDEGTMLVIAKGLEPGHMARIHLFGVVAADGSPLLHDELAYTVNQLPGAPLSTEHVAKIVPPPPARESGEEGWLRLTYGDATDLWTFHGWELVEAELDPADPTRFAVRPGTSHLVNTGPDPSDYVSEPVFGDAKIHVGFTLPQGRRSALYVQGRYGILLVDSTDAPVLTTEHCGALIGGPDFAGAAPALHAYRGPGQLHEVDVDFRAPRFDETGRKVENARLLRVRIDDVLVQENVELPGPSDGTIGAEVAEGPLVVVGTRGPVAIGDVQARPMVEGEPPVEAGWTKLLDIDADQPLADWTITEDGLWRVEDGVLVGEGPRSHLVSPRGDYRDLEIRARLKISDGGNSGLYFRATPKDADWPDGYEAQINSSFADPQKTGSLYGLAPLLTHLVAPDTWFEYRVLCRDEPEGTRVTIRVNGVVVNDFVDAERTHAAGHVILQQHHEGSVVEIGGLEVRELAPAGS